MQAQRPRYHLFPPQLMNHTPRPFEVKKARSERASTLDNDFLNMTQVTDECVKSETQQKLQQPPSLRLSSTSGGFGGDQHAYPAPLKPQATQLGLLSQKSECYDLAWFLRNTGPSSSKDTVADYGPPKLVKKRSQPRRKPSLGIFRPGHKRKATEAILIPVNAGFPGRHEGRKSLKLPNTVVSRVSKDGKTYLQILPDYKVEQSAIENNTRQCSSQSHDSQASVRLVKDSTTPTRPEGNATVGNPNSCNSQKPAQPYLTSDEPMQTALELESWISNLGERQHEAHVSSDTEILDSCVNVTVLKAHRRSRSLDKLVIPDHEKDTERSDGPDSAVSFIHKDCGHSMRQIRPLHSRLHLRSINSASQSSGKAVDVKAALASNPPTPGPAPLKPLPPVPTNYILSGHSKSTITDRRYWDTKLKFGSGPNNHPAALRRTNSETTLGKISSMGAEHGDHSHYEGPFVPPRSPLRPHDGNARLPRSTDVLVASSIINRGRPTLSQRVLKEDRIRARKWRDLKRMREQSGDMMSMCDVFEAYEDDIPTEPVELEANSIEPSAANVEPSPVDTENRNLGSPVAHKSLQVPTESHVEPNHLVSECQKETKGRRAGDPQMAPPNANPARKQQAVPEEQRSCAGPGKVADYLPSHGPTSSQPTRSEFPPRLSTLTESDRAPKCTSAYSNASSSSKSLTMEARIDNLERQNRLLEAALYAVLRTSGSFKDCECAAGALPLAKRESITSLKAPDSEALGMYYRLLQGGKSGSR